MSEHRQSSVRPVAKTKSLWVIDTRELRRRPGVSRALSRSAPTSHALGIEGVIAAPAGTEVELDLLLESVVEGVLVTGTASVPVVGECSRCLDPISSRVEVELTELFAYPDSITDATYRRG